MDNISDSLKFKDETLFEGTYHDYQNCIRTSDSTSSTEAIDIKQK